MPTYYKKKDCCLECQSSISYQVWSYSTNNLGLSLCIPCQNKFKFKSEKATPEAIDLYIALKIRGVPAELEKYDGHKTIDIAVPEAKVNIEVDGLQHGFNPRQAMADLKRTFYAFQKGFLTLRIPNTLVRCHLEETADYITDFLMESRDRREW